MQLDLKAIHSAIVAGLPVHARWTIKETPVDFDFSDGQRDICKPLTDIVECDEKEWSNLLIFGKSDYADGGGAAPWLGIRKTDGAVYGLDLEREKPMFLLNSSIECFIRTFIFFSAFLGENKPLPTDLETAVRNIDPEAYPMSDWRLLAEYLLRKMDGA